MGVVRTPGALTDGAEGEPQCLPPSYPFPLGLGQRQPSLVPLCGESGLGPGLPFCPHAQGASPALGKPGPQMQA